MTNPRHDSTIQQSAPDSVTVPQGFKGTAGPWRACMPGSNFHRGKKFIRDTEGQCIAVVSNEGRFECREANACLIAAAPDLLAAMQKMLRAYEIDGLSSAMAVFNTDGRTAIARALGDAS